MKNNTLCVTGLLFLLILSYDTVASPEDSSVAQARSSYIKTLRKHNHDKTNPEVKKAFQALQKMENNSNRSFNREMGQNFKSSLSKYNTEQAASLSTASSAGYDSNSQSTQYSRMGGGAAQAPAVTVDPKNVPKTLTFPGNKK